MSAIKVYSSSEVHITEEDILRRRAVAKAEWRKKHFVTTTVKVTTIFGKEIEVKDESLFPESEFTITIKTKTIFVP